MQSRTASLGCATAGPVVLVLVLLVVVLILLLQNGGGDVRQLTQASSSQQQPAQPRSNEHAARGNLFNGHPSTALITKLTSSRHVNRDMYTGKRQAIPVYSYTYSSTGIFPCAVN